MRRAAVSLLSRSEGVASRPGRSDLRTRWLVARLARCRTEARAEGLRTELALANLRLSETIARRYRHRGIDLDDLKRVAHAAMVEAAQRFDPGQGSDFASYAAPVVRARIRRRFPAQGRVRPGSVAGTGPAGEEEYDDLLAARVRLAHAMPCLDLQDRRILELRFLEGCGEEEIAARLGLSPTQVARSRWRILLQLRVAVGAGGPEAGEDR